MVPCSVLLYPFHRYFLFHFFYVVVSFNMSHAIRVRDLCKALYFFAVSWQRHIRVNGDAFISF